MRNLTVLGGMVVLGLLLVAPSASAATINFASLAQPGSSYTSYGSGVVVDGFLFSSTGSSPYGLVTWNLDHSNHPNDTTAASTALLEYTAGNTTTITRVGGGTFDLNQIDLAVWGVGQGGAGFNVLFTGVRPDASTVTQLLPVQLLYTSGHPLLQTGVFSGFTGLTSVYMTQGIYSSGGAFQFNNLVVDAESVPDPASTAGLLGLGLAALAAGARRLRARH